MGVEDKIGKSDREKAGAKARKETLLQAWNETQTKRGESMRADSANLLDQVGAEALLDEVRQKYWKAGKIRGDSQAEQVRVDVGKPHLLSRSAYITVEGESPAAWMYGLLQRSGRKLIAFPPPADLVEDPKSDYQYRVGIGYSYKTLGFWWPELTEGRWSTEFTSRPFAQSRQSDDPRTDRSDEWVNSPGVRAAGAGLSIVAVTFPETTDYALIVTPTSIFENMPPVGGTHKRNATRTSIYSTEENYLYHPKVLEFPERGSAVDKLEEALAQDYYARGGRSAASYGTRAEQSLQEIRNAGLMNNHIVQEYLNQR